MHRTALASSRLVLNELTGAFGARQLASDAINASAAPAQPSERQSAPGNGAVVEGRERYLGKNARNPMWFNEVTGKVIGGQSEDESLERFRRTNQSLPRLQGQVFYFQLCHNSHWMVVDQRADPRFSSVLRYVSCALPCMRLWRSSHSVWRQTAKAFCLAGG